jgi:Ca-activated chloride channel homolog
MHFAQPEYFNLLWAIPVLGLLIRRFLSGRERRLKKVTGPVLAERLSATYSRPRCILKALFLLCFFFFGIVAAARPQWGTQSRTILLHGVDIVAAIDVSHSMNAEDMTPDRFTAARNGVRRLLEESTEDRVGLVVFAGNATRLSPLTMDRGAILMLLDSLTTGMLTEPGTSLAAAITTASASFIAQEKKHKALVLFTDGEDLTGQLDSAVTTAMEAGVVIYTVGVGTLPGSPVPVRDAEGTIQYRKHPEGNLVISSLDEEVLMSIAARTGGRYFRATTSGKEMSSLRGVLSSLEKKEMESMAARTGQERFQFPLALAVIFFIISSLLRERRMPNKSERNHARI